MTVRPMATACLFVLFAAGSVVAEEPLADFWQCGRVRELRVRGMPEKDLAEWSRCGVNCVLHIKPDEAHKHGLKTRSWFTLNLMRPGNAWRPYGQGFEIEEIAGEGPTIKVVTGADIVRVAEMHHPVPQATDAVMQHLAPLLPERRLLTVAGPGAECVYVDVSRTEGGLLLQFLNYDAELHPRLAELDQQKADKTIPAGPLHVCITLPGAEFTRATLFVPGRPDHTLQLTANSFVVPELGQYAAVILKVWR